MNAPCACFRLAAACCDTLAPTAGTQAAVAHFPALDVGKAIPAEIRARLARSTKIPVLDFFAVATPLGCRAQAPATASGGMTAGIVVPTLVHALACSRGFTNALRQIGGAMAAAGCHRNDSHEYE